MPALLMCPPDYYGIEYEINPWMDTRRPADAERARAQWRALYETLTAKLGLAVELLAPQAGLPDLVFTANAGLVQRGRFIPSRFRFAERRREQPIYEAWFRAHDYTVFELPEPSYFEGEGDALWVGETLFAGYRIRTDIAAHRTLGDLVRAEVLSLELVDPRFYHLDTCFCPLGPTQALYYPPAFDDYGRKVIETFVPEPIPIEEPDALTFGCNAVVAGRDVVVQAGCAALERALETRGFAVHPVDLSEFHKAGGSAKCLVLWLA